MNHSYFIHLIQAIKEDKFNMQGKLKTSQFAFLRKAVCKVMQYKLLWCKGTNTGGKIFLMKKQLILNAVLLL